MSLNEAQKENERLKRRVKRLEYEMDDYLPPTVVKDVLTQTGISEENADELVSRMKQAKEDTDNV